MFKEAPAGELIEANCYARPNCLKQLPEDIIFIQFNNKFSYTKKFNRMTDCCNKERQRSKMLSSLCVTVTDDVLKLGYISVIFVDLGVKVDGTYYCDLFLSQQLLPAICHALASIYFRKQCHNI